MDLILPKGYGFRPFTTRELAEGDGYLFDALLIWEPPRKRGKYRYIVSADVADGLGQDRSVVEVIRCGTIEEPAEQVAEYASDQIPAASLACIIHTIGQYYCDDDRYEAMVAIETNNHGLSTQDTLQKHYGYTHFYVWEIQDARDEQSRVTNRIGWYTNPRTRPAMLSHLYKALTTRDELTNLPDLITHSPLLHEELKDFQTETDLGEAAASRGAHDDAIMATAIGNYVEWRQRVGELEPLEDRRRRRTEQLIRQGIAADQIGAKKPDWRNTAITAAEIGAIGSADDVDDYLYLH